jgi:hypothetical protein
MAHPTHAARLQQLLNIRRGVGNDATWLSVMQITMWGLAGSMVVPAVAQAEAEENGHELRPRWRCRALTQHHQVVRAELSTSPFPDRC